MINLKKKNLNKLNEEGTLCQLIIQKLPYWLKKVNLFRRTRFAFKKGYIMPTINSLMLAHRRCNGAQQDIIVIADGLLGWRQ